MLHPTHSTMSILKISTVDFCSLWRIWSSHGSDHRNYSFLRCDTVWSSRLLPTFWTNLLSPLQQKIKMSMGEWYSYREREGQNWGSEWTNKNDEKSIKDIGPLKGRFPRAEWMGEVMTLSGSTGCGGNWGQPALSPLIRLCYVLTFMPFTLSSKNVLL